MNNSMATRECDDEMRLADFIKAFEPLQKVCIYALGEDGALYEGHASDVPADVLDTATVESTHVYEWTIDVLVRQNGVK